MCPRVLAKEGILDAKTAKDLTSWPHLVRPLAKRLTRSESFRESNELGKPCFIINILFSSAMDPNNFHLEITNLAVSSRAELGRFQRSGEIPVPAATGGRGGGSRASRRRGGRTDPRFSTGCSRCAIPISCYILASPLPRHLSAGSNIMEFFASPGFQENLFRGDIHPQEGKKCPGYVTSSYSGIFLYQ